MPQKSTIELLPKDIFDKVSELYRAGATNQELVDAVEEMGKTVSHSAMGRHTQKINKISDKLNRSKMIASTIVEQLGHEPESKIARMNIELLNSAITDIVFSADEKGEITLGAGEAMQLSKALHHLSSARKTDAEVTMKIREEAAKDAKEAIRKSNVGSKDQRDELIKAVDEVLGVKRQ